jgi:repressor LexA
MAKSTLRATKPIATHLLSRRTEAASHQTLPLTPKELRVLDFVRDFSERRGYAPTYAEIQRELGYRALSSVQQFIRQLVHKGYLQAPLGESRKRALSLADTDNFYMIPMEGAVAAGRLTEAVAVRESFEVPRALLNAKDAADMASFFALRVRGDSMIGDCIMDGDVVIIRRQLSANNGQTVVALVDNDATIKRFVNRRTHIELHPANPDYEVIVVRPGVEFKILGVLAAVVRRAPH